MIIRVIGLLCVVLLTLTAFSSTQAEIDPYLRSMLDETDAGEIVKVTLKLLYQADIDGLLEELKSRSAPAAERHSAVIRALQKVAEESQPPVLAALEELKNEGKVVSYKNYWISNIFEVSCRADAVTELSDLEVVEIVYLTPVAVPVDVIMEEHSPAGSRGAEPGPGVIGADSLWKKGITGAGRVVGHIDTGVDGSHPAFSERWRGNFEPPEECWLAPGTEFPFDSSGHGTATMGILTGRDSDTGDTTGVAIDALWISARFGLDEHSVTPTEALQWMADPDGNPDTFDDAPDVVSNSWFYIPETECYQTDWDVIDNLEAAGVVVMFAAGNVGPDPETVASPASRNTSDINGFAVGAVHDSKQIANFSSRGPSPCDGITIKPEVTAPGVNNRTASLGSGYANASGTSIACPFAAGVVALLKQLNPEATVDEIKTAILTTAEDHGAEGDDNEYGMGVVNAYAAALAISPYQVEGTVTDGSSGLPIAGAEVLALGKGQRTLTDTYGEYNIGALVQEIQLLIQKFGYYPDTSDVLSLGDSTLVHDVQLIPLARGAIEGMMTDTLTGEGIRAGIILHSNQEPVDTVITDAETGAFLFPEVPVSSPPLVVYTGVEGRFIMPYPTSVLYSDTIFVEEGETSHIDLSAAPARVLIADDDDGMGYEQFLTSAIDTAGWTYYHHDVHENGESVIYNLDEFPQGIILIWYTGMKEETLTEEEQDSLEAFLDRGGKLFITGQNIAEDLSSQGSSFLTDRLHAGYGGNTDMGNVEGYDADPIFDDILMRTKGPNGADDQYSRDILIVDGVSVPACYYTEESGGADSVVAGLWIDDLGSRILFLGFGFEAVNRPSPPDTEFATRGEIMGNILSWLEGWVEIEDDKGGGEHEALPRSYSLSQNYPNPFNPTTAISFDIPDDGRKFHQVRLVIFDIRGRRVRILLEGKFPPGRHNVAWSGKDDSGRKVSSGLYIYRLFVDDRSLTRKMLLLR